MRKGKGKGDNNEKNENDNEKSATHQSCKSVILFYTKVMNGTHSKKKGLASKSKAKKNAR